VNDSPPIAKSLYGVAGLRVRAGRGHISKVGNASESPEQACEPGQGRRRSRNRQFMHRYAISLRSALYAIIDHHGAAMLAISGQNCFPPLPTG